VLKALQPKVLLARPTLPTIHCQRHHYTHGRLPGLVEPRYYMLAMSTELIWQTISTGSADTSRLGELLGSKLAGGEVIELRSDLGGGKTTFVKGLAKGAGSNDQVASPTFTLKRVYKTPKFQIFHYDFYRLSEPGILHEELAESIGDKRAVTVIEWSDIVKDVLPAGRLSIEFTPTANDPDERQVSTQYSENFQGIIREIETQWQESRP